MFSDVWSPLGWCSLVVSGGCSGVSLLSRPCIELMIASPRGLALSCRLGGRHVVMERRCWALLVWRIKPVHRLA